MLEKYKEFYIENGYVVIPGHEFISEKEHKNLLEVSDKLINTDNDNWLYHSNGTINKLQGAVTIVPEFLNLAKNKVLIKFAQSISNIGDNVDCYISKFFPQQKKEGQGYHSPPQKSTTQKERHHPPQPRALGEPPQAR